MKKKKNIKTIKFLASSKKNLNELQHFLTSRQKLNVQPKMSKKFILTIRIRMQMRLYHSSGIKWEISCALRRIQRFELLLSLRFNY